jgi:hypothetical protein
VCRWTSLLLSELVFDREGMYDDKSLGAKIQIYVTVVDEKEVLASGGSEESISRPPGHRFRNTRFLSFFLSSGNLYVWPRRLVCCVFMYIRIKEWRIDRPTIHIFSFGAGTGVLQTLKGGGHDRN